MTIFSGFGHFCGLFGGLTPKLWAPMKPAHQDASFGTFKSQIGPRVIEILLSKWRNLQKTVKYFFNINFHHQGATDPEVNGTVESGSSRCFFWHLAKSDQITPYLFLGGGTIHDKGAAGAGAAQNTILRLHYVCQYAWFRKLNISYSSYIKRPWICLPLHLC